jgi:pimeloyl-ACP methyl ester carboxylesterase
LVGIALCLLSAAVGCAPEPINPSFPVDVDEGRMDLSRMEDHPHSLQRPLVVIGGFLDPGFAAWHLQNEFATLTGDHRIVGVSLAECLSFDDCAQKIVRAVNQTWPSKYDGETIEVDVVGNSMGGLAARFAALPTDGKRMRLNIARLFTISSPLSGAEDAVRYPLMHPMQKSMRPGSPLYAKLNSESPDYPIYSYVRLGDWVVGAENAAPPGHTAWWVPNEPVTDPHSGAMYDPRILSDIARRLRGESPMALDPPAALPVE